MAEKTCAACDCKLEGDSIKVKMEAGQLRFAATNARRG